MTAVASLPWLTELSRSSGDVQNASLETMSIYRPNGARPSNLVNRIDDLNREQIPSSPLYTSEHGFAEILDTPTQRSSDLAVSGLLSDPRLDTQADTDTNDDNLLAVDQPLTDTIAMLTVLCGTCRRQRVFVKSNGQTIRCRNCRNQSLIAETGKLEIPETPHAASQNQASATQSSKEALSVTSTPVSTSDPAVPWFQSNLVVSKPKIKQKKISGSLVFSTEKASHKPLVQQDETTETSPVPKIINQILPLKEKPPMLEPSTQVSKTYGMDIMKVSVPTEIDLEQSKNDNGPPPPLVIVGGSKMDDSNLNLESITTRDDWERHAYDEYMPPQSIQSGTPIISHTGYASPDTSGSSDLIVKLPRLAVAKKRHTIRELAIIALAAAEEPDLTAEDIIDWLAKTFTYLRKGHGPWESAVKTRLSTLPELRRDKIPGVSHNMKTYSFIDASTRARYRKVFSEYCYVITTPVSEVAGSSEFYVKPLPALKDTGLPQSIKVIKTVPLEEKHPPVRTADTSEAICVTQVTPVMLPEGLSAPSMPFKRAIERTPQVDLSIIINDSKRETSYEAFLKAQTLSVDSMTEDQRVAKSAQIKARPSRKQFFGSDHRLGHVRRYGRQDIHDESDGAWKPPRLETGKDLAKRYGSTSMLDGPTLREVFDLPENAIPMNDGQTELAFRDGTRINGRLPRSRQIYKVGKMFGGEITVRTS
ncbi:hypothetical protein J1614_003942 [Plenodomus biglobosus]|nr:hypothetical protein J1614_003942 [Plenodomus biglobosus]